MVSITHNKDRRSKTEGLCSYRGVVVHGCARALIIVIIIVLIIVIIIVVVVCS